MPIVAKQIDAGSTLEQIRQQFNNLQSDVVTLQASPTYGTGLIFEGTTNDDFETTLEAQDPTADRTIYLPNLSGTLLTSDSVINSDTSTISANNSTSETVYLTFVDGATGNQGLESDTGLTWNPSTNVLTIGGIVIADGSTIGSASDQDALSISSGGNIALTQALTVTGTSTFNEDVTFTGAANNAVWDKSDNALEFADNAKAIFGTGGDFEIYHSTDNNTYLTETGSGNLHLRASNLYLDDHDGTQMLLATENGAVALYHNGSVKLATSAAGISVTGTATMSANVVIADAGNIGSASDTDAIAISAAGVVTFSQTPVFSSDLTLGDDLYLDSDGAVVHFGDDGEITLTHVADQGLRLEDSDKMMFGASSDLEIFHDGSNSYIKDTGTGNLTLQANQVNFVNAAGNETLMQVNEDGAVLILHDNSQKFTTTSGGISVTGTYTGTGLMTTGGNIVIPNDGQIGSASDTDSITIDSSGVVTMSQNLIITGDLTVNGTTTTVSTSNTVVGDSLIELNSGAGSNANDLGLVMERGSTGDNVLFVWDESGDHFSVGTTTATGASTGNLTYTLANFSAASIVGTLATAAQTNITQVGTLTTLTVDNVIINGTTIGHTSDTDLLGLASGVLTVSGRTDITGSLYLTGDEKHVRWYNGSNYINLGASSSLSSNLTFILPTADGTAGQALITDGSGNFSFAANNIGNATTLTIGANNSTDETVYLTFVDGATGEQGLETDTALSYNPSTGLLSTAGITLTGALTVAGTTTLNGALVLGDAAGDALTINATTTVNENMTWTDNDKAIFGTGGDLEIYHDGSNSVIADSGTGNLQLATSLFQVTNPGRSENIIYAAENAGVNLYYDNSKKLETFTDGVRIDGHLNPLSADGGGLGSAALEWSDLYLAEGATIQFGNDQDVVLTHVADSGIRLNDGDKLLLGTSDDLQLYHDGNNSALNHSGTGDFYIQSDQFYFRSASTSENMITGTVNAGVSLYYNGVSHLNVVSSGVNVAPVDGASVTFGADGEVVLTHVHDVGVRFADSDKLQFGAGGDLEIYHDGSNSFIQDVGTGSLIISTDAGAINLQKASSETMATFVPDGAVTLYHDNSSRLATTATGGTLTGTWGVQTALTPTSADSASLGTTALEFSDLYLADGAFIYFGNDQDVQLLHVADTGLQMGDSDKLMFGNGNDLQIWHDGSHSHIHDLGTGNFYIKSDGGLIGLQKDNGEEMANFNTDGSVQLYYDNAIKFATTSAGVTITGTVTATAGATLLVKDSGGSTLKTIKGMS